MAVVHHEAIYYSLALLSSYSIYTGSQIWAQRKNRNRTQLTLIAVLYAVTRMLVLI